MFIRNGSAFTHFDASKFKKDGHQGLPAGAYVHTYDHMMAQHIFTPSTMAGDTYVPVASSTYREVLRELQSFLDPTLHARLAAAGILNKRGILLHGKPGSGKSSMIMSFTSLIIEHDGILLVQPDVDYLRSIVDAIREDDPCRPIFVFWDEFDDVLDDNEHGVLRFLDGIDSSDQIFTFACLNDIKAVPERIYDRPSRFGIVASIDDLNDADRKLFLQTKYPDLTGKALAEAVKITKGMVIDHIKEVGLQLTVYGRTVSELQQRMARVKGLGS